MSGQCLFLFCPSGIGVQCWKCGLKLQAKVKAGQHCCSGALLSMFHTSMFGVGMKPLENL